MTGVRLGVVGLSDGNGHPYSWSAIVNGYDPAAMAACPFPSIPRYLALRRFPEDAAAGARVTHVWTQDTALSAHIAAAALIPHVVAKLEDMIGQVDAVLLARDDPATRAALAGPFLDAGLPVFIDKALGAREADARALLARRRRPEQIFAGSAGRWWFEHAGGAEAAIGPLRYADACVFNQWDTYAAHAIEPLLALLAPEHGLPDRAQAFAAGPLRGLTMLWNDGAAATVTAHATPEVPLRVRLFGPDGMAELPAMDNFTAFKRGIERFLAVVRGEAEPPSDEFLLTVVRMIEMGRGNL